jgi:16S rRNA (cytosine1402-N4)-methyltransferase
MHIPVLQKEVIKYLAPSSNENFVDCTFGGGGHTIAILKENGPKGKVLGIDQDPELISSYKLRVTSFKKRLILVCGNFADLKKITEAYKFRPINGVLLDLGMSSWHLQKSGRGFTFQKDEPLVMRYDGKCQNYNLRPKAYLTAKEILNKWPQEEIERILKEYGEERFAKRIAEEIVRRRKIVPIQTTSQLVEIIKKSVPAWYQRKRIHPATKTFQALRIAVNEELTNLKKVLPQIVEILEKQGRVVIISFHSLEDRIVKTFFKEMAKKQILEILTKKPIRPGPKEIQTNPRARSAKLRAAKII